MEQAAIDLMLGAGDVEELEESEGRERTAEERMDAVQSLWTEEQAQAIRACTEALPASETLLGGWVIISINKRGLLQERVVVLSREAVYRCKYKYKEGRLAHYKRIPLTSMLGAYIGPYRSDHGRRPCGLCLLTNDKKVAASARSLTLLVSWRMLISGGSGGGVVPSETLPLLPGSSSCRCPA
jgi:hypothetical protein